MGWSGPCRGGVGHTGVGCVIHGWGQVGGSCMDGVEWVIQGWGRS